MCPSIPHIYMVSNIHTSRFWDDSVDLRCSEGSRLDELVGIVPVLLFISHEQNRNKTLHTHTFVSRRPSSVLARSRTQDPSFSVTIEDDSNHDWQNFVAHHCRHRASVHERAQVRPKPPLSTSIGSTTQQKCVGSSRTPESRAHTRSAHETTVLAFLFFWLVGW